MKIGMDISTLDLENPTGCSRYILELLRAFREYSPDTEIQGFLSFKQYFRKRNSDIVKCVDSALPFSRLFTPTYSGINVFHGPDFHVPVFGSTAKILTIHDLALSYKKHRNPNFHNSDYQYIHRVKKMNPDAIIVPSAAVKKEIEYYLPEFSSRTEIIWHGANHLYNLENVFNPWKQKQPFMLYIGTIEKRKNIDGILGAFELLRENEDCTLIIAGKGGFGGHDIETRIQQSPYKNDIHYLGYISEYTRQLLLSAAELFVFPSHYEGFGFPVVEAMQLGLPILTSNVGAMKEIAGEAAVLVNPDDLNSIAEGMQLALSDSNLRNTLKRIGKNRVREFTWQSTARKTLELYRRVATIV